MIFLGLYLVLWHCIFAAYTLHASWIMNPHEWILIRTIYTVFAVMCVGYGASLLLDRAIARRTRPDAPADTFAFDAGRVRIFQLIVGGLAATVLAITIALDGPPPFLASFGIATLYYLEYGNGILGPLQPCLNIVFLTAEFIERKSIRWAVRGAIVMVFLIVAQRGPLMMMLIQFAALTAIRNRHRWRNFAFAWRTATLGTVILATGIESMELVRMLRGSLVSGAMSYLKVSKAAQLWPLGFLWFVLYLVQPSSNITWMLDQRLGGAAGIGALDALVPRLFRPDNPLPDRVIPGAVDNVSTYLAPMYLAYGWPGLVIEHLILGAACYFFTRPSTLQRMPLFAALFACQFAFTGFADYFMHLGNIFEYMLIAIFYGCCAMRIRPAAQSAAQPAGFALGTAQPR